jgi:hypothetical protein
MTSFYIDAVHSMLPYVFQCYKEKGFQVVLIKSGRKEHLNILSPPEVLDFDKDTYFKFIKRIERLEDIPEEYLKDFIYEFSQHVLAAT